MFNLELIKGENFTDGVDNVDLLKVSFVKDLVATNVQLVEYVNVAKNDVFTSGGSLLKINGACSLIILANLIPDLIYWYGAIAVYDPKLEGYVVSSSQISEYKVGQLLK